jgi:ribonuclease PH
MVRESSKGRLSGRTQEISRLIGRSLRSVVDLSLIPDKTVWLDCDVIQADGGTRTASITGAFVALVLAIQKLLESGKLSRSPLIDFVAAVSVGMVDGIPCLDLCYTQDVNADVDMNVVMTGRGNFVEIQGTAEGQPFSGSDLESLLGLARQGIGRLVTVQKDVLGKRFNLEKVFPLGEENELAVARDE